jgi:hypothetical protein
VPMKSFMDGHELIFFLIAPPTSFKKELMSQET